MREDIVAGLKNAYERGESLQKAVQSFINAGYNQNEVEEAAKQINSSYSSQEQTQESTSLPKQKKEFPLLPKSPSLNNGPVSSPSITPIQSKAPENALTKTPNRKRKLKILKILFWTIGFILLIAIGFSVWKILTGEWMI